tara:strand:+ start:2242 stop:2622 length:381 start_codon:yes stop_codon:yes gene_type:complete
MVIKEIETSQLKLKCLDLITKTFVELGQVKDDKTLAILAQTLASDLLEDFPNLTFEDIQASFRQGVRNSKEFHLTVKTYYKWIKAHRQLIWNNASIEPERQDKRLKYRSRKGTGLKSITNIKQIKC